MTISIGADDLLRFESLGDNCEFGFVLRRLSCEAGSLFRWASMKPDQLLTKLRANFEGMYRFENLSPLRTGMVLDSAYGIGWHSDMKSDMTGGRLAFRDDEATRRALHRRETRKIQYLQAKFTARAALGGVIFVVKSNPGIAPATIDGLYEALAALAGHDDFALLEVQATDDPARIGRVDWQRPGLMRGYVTRFAPYHQADDIDAAAWFAIVQGALRLFPCHDWEQRHAALRIGTPDALVQLRFPFGADQDMSKPLTGDLRAGTARLLNGNSWCRPYEGLFRLHGPDPERPGTTLRWTGVHAPGPFHLGATLRCPLRDSVPLRVAVAIAAEDGATLAEERFEVHPGRATDLVLDAPAAKGALTVSLTVNAVRPLAEGERAVLDLSPPALHPEQVPAVALPAKAA
ncbi:hypothetical protein [Azospirillum brasilense]|uniref:Uncharacterized protein n=1 Tax=Azospirillum brasilense TaxID=192 RepID=A0A6L3B8B6_AZOBR|nr:hypothetical protein [Azospirillum brasilense]KAA0687713.1 hypothetical protein DS837_05795 [Azospirillum brasilense]